MFFDIPHAYHRFQESSWYLALILKPAVQDLPPEPIDLSVKLKLSVLAEDSGDGRQSTPQNQAVAYLAFDRALQPLTELTRQVLSSATFTARSVEDLAHLQGQTGECRFGPPNPFTHYQRVVAWRPVPVLAGAPGAIPLGDYEPAPYLFRLHGAHFVLRFTAGQKHEDGIFDACAGLHLTQRLLQRPGRPVDTLELMNETNRPTLRRPADRQDVCDRQAIAAVLAQIRECTAEIDRARKENNFTMAAVYEAEVEQLRAYLHEARDDRGRPRRLDAGDPAELARKTIVNGCERTWQHVAGHGMPGLAAFLRTTIHISRDCCLYQPPPPAPDWVF
jgi:hypothetical protein